MGPVREDTGGALGGVAGGVGRWLDTRNGGGKPGPALLVGRLRKERTMSTTFKAGETISCEVLKMPRAQGSVKTIQRLMRRDPTIGKQLRTAQEHRRQNMTSHQRGGRMWVDRERCSKVAVVSRGAKWTMTYTVDLARDLDSVSSFLKVGAA